MSDQIELKKGDRVIVTIPRRTRHPEFAGYIVGEARDGTAWYVIKDGTKHSRGIPKSFCKPEDAR